MRQDAMSGEFGSRNWQQALADELANRWARLARVPIRIHVDRIEATSVATAFADCESPTCFARLTCFPMGESSAAETPAADSVITEPPGSGGSCATQDGVFHVELAVLQPLIDRMLGGNESSAIVRRPLTEIEKRLASRAIQCWIEAFSAQVDRDTQSNRDAQVTSPSSVQVTDVVSDRAALKLTDDATHVSTHCRFEMADATGRLDWSLPAQWLQQLSRGDADTEKQTDCGPISDDHDSTANWLSVELAPVTLDDTALENLEVGDIIATDHRCDQPLVARTTDGRNFAAFIGAKNGRKAVRLGEALSDE